MKQKIMWIIALLLVVFACGRQAPPAEQGNPDLLESPEQQAFFDNLSTLCGQSFQGIQIFRSPHSEGWAHLEMVIHVEVCEDDHIHIPFHLGEDKSRTWIFLVEDQKLRFQHDHRHLDGTPEDASLYGGYADDSGTAFVQHFPADEYTGEVIEGGEGNVWTVAFDEQMTTLSYRLQRDGEDRLRVDFDLTRPL